VSHKYYHSFTFDFFQFSGIGFDLGYVYREKGDFSVPLISDWVSLEDPAMLPYLGKLACPGKSFN